jgi:hypothetical protein
MEVTMGKEKLDRVDESTIENVVTNSLKLAVTDLIISRYANESQTYVVTKDAMSVEEAADDLIDYARHMSSGKYMYAILAGIDKQFTHDCVAEFIRNSPAIMDQIKSNVAKGSLKRSDTTNGLPADTVLHGQKVSDDIMDLEVEDEGVLQDSDQFEVETGPVGGLQIEADPAASPKIVTDLEGDSGIVDFTLDPTQTNGIKWND